MEFFFKHIAEHAPTIITILAGVVFVVYIMIKEMSRSLNDALKVIEASERGQKQVREDAKEFQDDIVSTHDKLMSEMFDHYKITYDDLSNRVTDYKNQLEKCIEDNKEIMLKFTELANRYSHSIDMLNATLDKLTSTIDFLTKAVDSNTKQLDRLEARINGKKG